MIREQEHVWLKYDLKYLQKKEDWGKRPVSDIIRFQMNVLSLQLR